MSDGNRQRRKEAGLLPSGLKCGAHKKNGDPCKRPPMNGATVCRSHGGAAPQVVAAARRRLMGASNNVAVLLLKIAEDEKTPPAVRLAAIKDVLDRAGVTVKQEVEVTLQPWQQLIEGIVADVGDQYVRPTGPRDGEVLDAEVVADDDESPLLNDLPPRPALPDVPAPAPSPTPPADEPRIPSRRRWGSAGRQ